MKKRLFAALLLSFAWVSTALADEGMWLLPYIQKLNIADMKAKGLKLEAEDIYSANGSSLKDAIVIFGGGCTGEVVSDQGLVFTNHHCGYGAIQQHSTVEHDYLKDGFWAASFAEELPTPGLQVTFIRHIEDVTDRVLAKVNDGMSAEKRAETIKKNIDKITSKLKLGAFETAQVQEMLGGNQYILFVKQVFTDIRMVGAPPSSIGKFGGDTDNWMWPRHTGDFSIFRIYADKDNNPAAYSPDNVPYKPAKWLPVSIGGVKEGDYVMIMGFPGTTQRYMTSYEIDKKLEVTNPIRIKCRGVRQDVLKADMMADPKVKIQYASKYAGSSNYWKNAIGESRGLRRLDVKGSKKAIEKSFSEWIAADPAREALYGDALPAIERSVARTLDAEAKGMYLSETLYNIELINMAYRMAGYDLADKLAKGEDTEAIIASFKTLVPKLYKDINMPTDKKVAKAMIELYMADVDKADWPSALSLIDTEANGDLDAALDYLYENSIFSSEEKLMSFLDNPDAETLENDYGYIAAESLLEAMRKVSADRSMGADYKTGHRLFIRGLMEQNPDKVYYPDANFTIRMTYGNVLLYKAADAVNYDFRTTIKGIMEKEDPNNAYEFTVPEKLKELYKTADYGRYGEDGTLYVGFISNNDITGGNSGSPVINGKGELVGLAFDGNWEAMSGNIAFEPELQRCISVDVRYVLFVIDKYAGCTRIIDELDIVK
ncbi:MAG: S46 family peptidase [Rikenellaceae bacterium]|nr:S46 family peptidase [Rikenellaceae bacterium]